MSGLIYTDIQRKQEVLLHPMVIGHLLLFNFRMEEYMVGPLTTDVVTHTWKVFLPAGTYIYDAYFFQKFRNSDDGTV